MLSLLGTTFVEILKNEWLGLIASAFILISFLTSNQIKTRIINSIGCVVFVVYGFLLPTYSTALMNGAMLIVHAVFLTKYFVKKRKEKAQPEETDAQAVTEEEKTDDQ
ncbi:MAG: hypothetical protein K2N84_00870 [Clostridia bacterium]|nr:hypothetical protein [Clostridia bacterium]